MAHVEVTRIIPIRRGSLQAFATILLDGTMRINSIRVIKQEAQKPWVSLPQSEKVNEDGSKSYYPIIEVEPDIKDAIQRAVLDAWQRGENGF